ncbi:MAG: hypothetical protein GY928_16485 [Colwellia sp.]|nr:hypothetical protein [Colwellia sp.]
MPAFNKSDAYIADLHNGEHDFSSDTLKIKMTNTQPLVTDAIGDITEISAGNGYVSGGLTVSIASSTQTGGAYSLVPAADPVLTATGAIPTFQYDVLYNSTANKIIGWWDRGSALTMANGDTHTVDLAATISTAT